MRLNQRFLNYGIPYLGSKNRIMGRLIATLPESDAFVDLFAGGCSVTHAALLSGKWRRVIANDKNPLPLKLFKDSIEGKARGNFRWISRKEFFERRETDPYAKYLFSFSNNGADYQYPEEVEPLKREICDMILEEDWKRRRVMFRILMRKILAVVSGSGKPADGLVELLGRCQSLECLERLECLNSLGGLPQERLTICCKDYREVEIPDNATVYCDIPYRTAKQAKGTYVYKFGYDEFYEWALSRDFPVFVSEYTMPEGFSCVSSFRHMACRGIVKKGVQEKVFVQSKFAEALKVSA